MAQPEGKKIIDPVCGMTVEPEGAQFICAHEGTTYLFCNRACLKKFQANPARYLTPADVTSGPAEALAAHIMLLTLLGSL